MCNPSSANVVTFQRCDVPTSRRRLDSTKGILDITKKNEENEREEE